MNRKIRAYTYGSNIAEKVDDKLSEIMNDPKIEVIDWRMSCSTMMVPEMIPAMTGAGIDVSKMQQQTTLKPITTIGITVLYKELPEHSDNGETDVP